MTDAAKSVVLSREDTRAVFDHLSQCWLNAVADVCGVDVEDADDAGRMGLLYELDTLLHRKVERLPAGDVQSALKWMFRGDSQSCRTVNVMDKLKPMTYQELVDEYRKGGVENVSLRVRLAEADEQLNLCEDRNVAALAQEIVGLRKKLSEVEEREAYLRQGLVRQYNKTCEGWISDLLNGSPKKNRTETP